MAKRNPACGNPACGSSTGICDRMTFGSGRLNDMGYWEKPCRICAEAFDKDKPNIIAAMRQEKGDDIEEYLKQATWLNEPAWPTS